MKVFLKMLLAVLVGAGLLVFICFMLVSSLLGSFIGGKDMPATGYAQGSILMLAFDRPIAEQDVEAPVKDAIPFGLAQGSGTGLFQICRAIDAAAADPNISMIYVTPQYLEAGMTQVEEMREALARFRRAGKPIIAYADAYSQVAYYLASVADKILLNPAGNMEIKGMSVTTRYYGALLEKTGVEVAMLRHGAFKSGMEHFSRSHMSAEEEQQMKSFLNECWEHWRSKMAASRDVPASRLDSIANTSMEIMPGEALHLGLVDQVACKDQVADYLCQLRSVQTEDQLSVVNIGTYAALRLHDNVRAKNKIALVYADGEMITGSKSDGVGSEEYVSFLRSIRLDTSYKALVLRINSPGGDPLAAALIARELELFAADRPVVVSMGDYAASGGYWIAAPATHIMASPLSLTGSIGVYGMMYNGEKALQRHLGVNADVVKTHAMSDAPNLFKTWTQAEKASRQAMIDSIYDKFTGYVMKCRYIDPDKMAQKAEGRIFSGLAAIKEGLADESGGLTEALGKAARLASVDRYALESFPKQRGFVEKIMATLGRGEVAWQRTPFEILGEFARNNGKVQARFPAFMTMEY